MASTIFNSCITKKGMPLFLFFILIAINPRNTFSSFFFFKSLTYREEIPMEIFGLKYFYIFQPIITIFLINILRCFLMEWENYFYLFKLLNYWLIFVKKSYNPIFPWRSIYRNDFKKKNCEKNISWVKCY